MLHLLPPSLLCFSNPFQICLEPVRRAGRHRVRGRQTHFLRDKVSSPRVFLPCLPLRALYFPSTRRKIHYIRRFLYVPLFKESFLDRYSNSIFSSLQFKFLLPRLFTTEHRLSGMSLCSLKGYSSL